MADSVDYGYQDGVGTSMNPGNTVLISTVIFCVLLIAALPCMVSVGKRFQNHEEVAAETDSSAASKSKGTPTSKNLADNLRGEAGSSQVGRVAPYHERGTESEEEEEDDDDGDDVASALVSAIFTTSPHGGPLKRRQQMNILHREAQIEHEEMGMGMETHEFDDSKSSASNSYMGRISHDEVSIRDAVDAPESVYKDAVDLMIDESPTGSWFSQLGTCFDKLLVIAEWDYETRRICKLGGPFVTQALLVGIMETVRVALIGRCIGTPALSAYVVVTMFVGMTTVFLKGFQDACTTLCSQAIGAKNNLLAGQYIQIATILYLICYIPFFLLWMFVIGNVFTWLGYDYVTKEIGENFVLLFLLSSFLRGISNSAHALLDVIGKENYSTVFISAQEVVATLATLFAALQPGASNLQLVGLLFIVVEAIALILNSAIIVWNGWFDEYLDGLIGGFAIMNTKATKLLLVTAAALSFGELIAYGEWELLTIFASTLGPSEVTTWGLLGTLWDALELVTEAVADAGEVRTAFLLGAGQPAQAKLSSYKTLYLGILASIFITACMFIAGESIPTWLTNDPTIQRLTAELIPLFGIGNIALSLGTLSWTLVGAQGRFRLSTAVGLSGAWLITIPMSAILTIAYNLDLQGQTAAIVVGYMVSGTVNTYILIQSDWPKLSRRIISQHARNVGEDDFSSSGSGSSHSSSDGTESHGNTGIMRDSKVVTKGGDGLNSSDSKVLPDMRTSNRREEDRKSVAKNDTNRPLPGDFIQAKDSTANDPCSRTSNSDRMRKSIAELLDVSPKPAPARTSVSKK